MERECNSWGRADTQVEQDGVGVGGDDGDGGDGDGGDGYGGGRIQDSKWGVKNDILTIINKVLKLSPFIH